MDGFSIEADGNLSSHGYYWPLHWPALPWMTTAASRDAACTTVPVPLYTFPWSLCNSGSLCFLHSFYRKAASRERLLCPKTFRYHMGLPRLSGLHPHPPMCLQGRATPATFLDLAGATKSHRFPKRTACRGWSGTANPLLLTYCVTIRR